MFKSIEEIKQKGEFIKKGSVFPRRIIKCDKRKFQHVLKAGCDQWAFSTRFGYVIYADNVEQRGDVPVTDADTCPKVTVAFHCSPYHKGGSTHWVGCTGIDDDAMLDRFNQVFSTGYVAAEKLKVGE